ncbi:hypothetical protein BC827DRAFT_1380479 [Russula dissimulans]|nr:hypothetical protein BC827DRAFT_1380479 [Russula dissimulans]
MHSIFVRMVGVGDSSVAVGYRSLEGMSKSWHVLSGLYIWEFLTTLDYEWSVIRGRRPYRWTIWTLGYVCFGAASSLILLRVIAVWNRNKVITWFAGGLWITNVAFLIQGKSLPLLTVHHQVSQTIVLHFEWLPTQACIMRSIDGFKLSLIVTLITDIALLLMVLVGLLRLRCPGGCSPLDASSGIRVSFGSCCHRGEVPPVVCHGRLALLPPPKGASLFCCTGVHYVNINTALDLTFQLPSLVIMTIAASRTHRALAEYASETMHIASSGLKFPTENPPILQTRRTPAVQVTLPTMEVSMQMAREQYPASHSSLDIDINEQQDDKLNGLAIDRDLESGMAERVP